MFFAVGIQNLAWNASLDGGVSHTIFRSLPLDLDL